MDNSLLMQFASLKVCPANLPSNLPSYLAGVYMQIVNSSQNDGQSNLHISDPKTNSETNSE